MISPSAGIIRIRLCGSEANRFPLSLAHRLPNMFVIFYFTTTIDIPFICKRKLYANLPIEIFIDRIAANDPISPNSQLLVATVPRFYYPIHNIIDTSIK